MSALKARIFKTVNDYELHVEAETSATATSAMQILEDYANGKALTSQAHADPRGATPAKAEVSEEDNPKARRYYLWNPKSERAHEVRSQTKLKEALAEGCERISAEQYKEWVKERGKVDHSKEQNDNVRHTGEQAEPAEDDPFEDTEVAAEETALETPPADDPDEWGESEAASTEHTLDDVRKAVGPLGREKGVALLKSIAGVQKMSDVPPEKYGALIEAAQDA